MKNHAQTLPLIVVIVASALVGVLTVRSPALLVLGLVAALWVVVPAGGKLFLVVGAACLPFTFGDVGAIPDLLVGELLIPVAAASGLIMLMARREPVFRGVALPYWGAISVFVAVNLIHAVLGSLTGASVGALGSGSTGLRAYFDMLLGPLGFAAIVWLGALNPVHGSNQRLLRWLLWLSAIAAGVRIASYYIGFEMPLLGGVFRYGVVSRIVTGGTADRIGGLAEAASLGLACLFGVWYSGDHRRWLLFPGILLSAATVLSGGRAFFLGVLIAGALLVAVLVPGSRVRAIALSIVAGGIGVSAVVFSGLTAQFSRLTAIGGGIALQDPARYAAIRFQIEEFVRSPLIGKGIGATTVAVADPFVAVQVAQGGHATYTSVLANQGLVGLFSFLYVAVQPVLTSFGLMRGSNAADERHRPAFGVMVFVFVFAIIRLTMFAAGGNGYTDITPYVWAGVLVALLGEDVQAGDADV